MRNRKGFLFGVFVLVFGLSSVIPFRAQPRASNSTSGALNQPSPAKIEEIIRQFAAKEAEFRRARELYNYQQSVKIQTLTGNRVDGEYYIVTDVTFGRDNKRIENVVYAPPSTLQRINLTKEDFYDLVHITTFDLTTDNLDKYDIQYLGHEKIDEITAYAFFVKPKQMMGEERYFEGEIWVDDQDFQIVKSWGRPVFIPTKHTIDQRFPIYETYREQIDGKYWFPTFTRADEAFNFPSGEAVHIREIILYRNYKQFRSDVKITYGEALEDKDKKKKE